MIEGHIIWAAVFALLFALLFEFIPISPLYGKLRQAIALLRNRAGLKAIYLRIDNRAREQLEETFKKADFGDQILIVGRTHYGLLRNNEHLITQAIKRGVTLKVIMLDRQAVAKLDSGIDLRFLRIKHARWQLARDLHDAEDKLKELRDHCKQNNLTGSLLVYRTDVLVQSSVIIHVPGKPGAIMRLTYDFSFGEKPSDKFIQCYECEYNESAQDFCNRLHRFYKGMLGDLNVCSLANELSFNPSQEEKRQSEVVRQASDRITKFIDDHRESEAIRGNALTRILPAAAQTFKSLHSGDPAPPPLSVQIELTNKCSTACSHCFRFEALGQHAAEMGTDQAKQLLTDLKAFSVRTITLSGGEPTQHSKFAEILRHAAQQGLATGVLSNGVGLSDEVLDSIIYDARWLRLSIDGSTADVYGKVRRSLVTGENAFAEVESTVKRFVDRNSSAPHCKLAICYTIQHLNAEDVPHMISWVRGLSLPDGDKCLTFKFAHGNNGFRCTKEQLKYLYEDVFRRPEFIGAANLDYLRWFLDNQSSLPDLIAGRPTQGLYVHEQTRCFTPHLFALIDPNGDVFPCCFLFEDNKGYNTAVEDNRRKHRIGNVFLSRFEDVWRSRDYEKVREELKVIDPTSEKYRACGECTRHCNHNRWLSELYKEYKDVCDAGGDGNDVMSRIIGKGNAEGVWL